MEVDSKGVVTASGNLEIFSKKTKDAEKSAGTFDDTLRKISPSALASVAGVTALVGAIKGLVGLSGKMTQMVSHFEQTEVGLGTVLQDAQKGKELFESLRKFSFDTTFGVDELASASTQLLNVGISTRQLQGDLKMLGDLAGGNKVRFAELTDIFAKINSTGKATSIQLQQIANRGIPINQTLKQMGVVGTASAKQITEAFQKLTSEGGQFNNAMNNIIDTIEGKEGFITDTFKEILVNFSDASGLTDLYKSLLDSVYSALENINKGLAKINESPILKALLRGAIVASLVTLVSLIVGSLIPKLSLVIGKLTTIATLKAMISPTALIGLAVGGLVAGLTLVSESESETEKATRKANEELKEQIKLLKERYEEQKEDSSTKEYDKINTREELLKNQIKKAQNDYEYYKSNTGIDDWDGFYATEMTNSLNQLRDYQKQLRELQGSMSYYLGKSEEAHNKWIDDTISKLEIDYKNAQNDIATAWAEMDDAKVEKLEEEYKKFKEIATMNTSAEIVTNASGQTSLKYNNDFSKEELDKTNKILSKIEKEIKDAKIKNWKSDFESVTTDYQSWILNQMNVNIDDELKKIADGKYSQYFYNKDEANRYGKAEGQFKSNSVGTATLLQNALKNDWAKFANEGNLADLLGVTKSDTLKSQSDNLKTTLFNLVKYADVAQEDDKDGRWKKGELMVSQSVLKEYMEKLDSLSVDYYNEQLNELREVGDLRTKLLADELGMTVEQYEATKEAREEAKKLKDIALAKTLSEYADAIGGRAGTALKGVDSVINGTDVGTLVNNFMDSDKSKAEAVADSFISILSNIIGGMEGITLILNPITNALKEFEPLLKSVMLIVYGVVRVLQPLAKFIMTLLNWLTGGLFDELANSWDELVSAQKNETSTLKKLNEEYENLYKAMVEQEEYYIEMKKQINSDTYRDSTYKVNDMILTSNGTFSTHPEDTIMAMKHPEDLMKAGGVVMIQPIINNTMPDSASVQVSQRTNAEGMTEMLVTISRKVASDVARGVNGWDNALTSRENRLRGTSRM